MKKQVFLFYIFRSNYCKITFLAALLIGYFLIPHFILMNPYLRLVAMIFLFSFALTTTCIVRNIKEKIVQASFYQSSIISVIATIIGIAAFQVCGLGMPVCGASLGVGIFSMILPGILFSYLNKYSLEIIILALIFQFASLMLLKCFQPVIDKEKIIKKH